MFSGDRGGGRWMIKGLNSGADELSHRVVEWLVHLGTC